MEIQLDDDLRRIVLNQTSFQFMKVRFVDMACLDVCLIVYCMGVKMTDLFIRVSCVLIFHLLGPHESVR